MKLLTPDFCVIGAGSAGLSFAAGAAQMGASVVLLEKNLMGGDCLNTGCVPSKALLAAAHNGLSFKKAMEHVHKTIKTIEPHDSQKRFEGLGVKVVREAGSFKDSTAVQTKNHTIKAKRFIIATGSYPFVPPIEGLNTVPYLTNETLFDLKTLPKNLVIIGGGPIGMEMAEAFNALGSTVTVLEAGIALPKDDADFTKILKKILIDKGIALQEKASIQKVTKKTITYLNAQGAKKTVSFSHILVATGRRPRIADLGLEKADIAYTPRGITVDDSLRTSNKSVYALGDCAGGYQFTHVAGDHASIALRNSIFRLRAKTSTRVIPWVTYTSPELAHVGAQESELLSKNIAYKAYSLSFKENDRAVAQNAEEGMIKVLLSPKGFILGATILAPSAGELIFPYALAMQNKIKIGAFANTIAPYPTLSDVHKRIAGLFYAPKVFSPMMKTIVRFLMRFS